MYEDEIISDVWKNREAYARKHKHNLHSIVCDLQERQKRPFSKVVDRRKKVVLAVGEEIGTYKSE
jgi:hypothetical protein